MKILIFTDLHANERLMQVLKKKASNADLIICLGDLTIFENDMKKLLKEIDEFGKKLLIIPGNHETHEEMSKMCKDFKNIIYLHQKHHEIDNILFLGHGLGGFALRDLEFELKAKEWKDIIKKEHKIVLFTHGPPKDTAIDMVGKNHVGNKSYKEFILKYQPAYALSGHLHENFYKTGKVGKTIVLNPGPDGRIITI